MTGVICVKFIFVFCEPSVEDLIILLVAEHWQNVKAKLDEISLLGTNTNL